MYVIYDLQTGETREKSKDFKQALTRATILEELFAYINGHEFGVKIEN